MDKPLTDDHAQLFKFYAVDNYSDLVDMQSKHIERLQKQIKPDNRPAFIKPREG